MPDPADEGFSTDQPAGGFCCGGCGATREPGPADAPFCGVCGATFDAPPKPVHLRLEPAAAPPATENYAVWN